MQLVLQYPTGLRVEAVLLAVTRSRMRVALRDRADTVEFRLRDGRWTSDQGEAIELESMIAEGEADWARAASHAAPAHASAA